MYLSGYRCLGNGDTDRREILLDGRYRSQTYFGLPQAAPKSQIFRREYIENGKSQRYMSDGA